jgi:hypothetical protein
MAEAGDVLRRLNADAHLVAVVGARVREAVDGRANDAAQDATIDGDPLSSREVRLLAVGHAHTTSVGAADSRRYARSRRRHADPAGFGSEV